MHEDAHFLPQADAQSLQSAKGLVAEQLLPVKPDAQAGGRTHRREAREDVFPGQELEY